MVRDFYDAEGITDQKVIVFSDSLNVENCLEYKVIAEEAGFKPTFGVGTYFTSKLAFLAVVPPYIWITSETNLFVR